ncbi:hypothetical protein Rhow_008755 [Rhodococcus wratislaviensis]|uniref:Uncharacterized protein n=1 Tax=Rhodococcus wratislaviensis TaxID=44752 RepID=A0A402CL68_RHOWR|nr:hypothetical protein Rhow_008755 [Rhodococcus wratislaviensis]
MEETADEFAETLRHLSSVVVSDRQWFSFLDAWYPVPEELVEMYRRDVRACIWRGSAFGR